MDCGEVLVAGFQNGGTQLPAAVSFCRRAICRKRQHERRYPALRAPFDRIEAAVTASFSVTVAELRSRTRGTRRCALARQTAIYLAHVSLGASMHDVAAVFRRHRSTVAHACGLIEDLRDAPAFDDKIVALETQCREIGVSR